MAMLGCSGDSSASEFWLSCRRLMVGFVAEELVFTVIRLGVDNGAAIVLKSRIGRMRRRLRICMKQMRERLEV